MHRIQYKGTYTNQTMRFDTRSKKSNNYVSINNHLKLHYCSICGSHSCRPSLSGFESTIRLPRPNKSMKKQTRKHPYRNLKEDGKRTLPARPDDYIEYIYIVG